MVVMVTVIMFSMVMTGITTSSDHYRRFIFNTPSNQDSPFVSAGNSGQFCSFCPLRCNYGYVTATSGCLMCRCKTKNTGSSSAIYNQPSNNVYLPNPCLPHVRYCNINCPGSLQLGANGCQYCACATSITTVLPTPQQLILTAGTKAPYIRPTVSNISVNYQPHEIFLSNPCSPHIRYCPIKCAQGLQLGHNGCQYCACANSNMTTASASYPIPTVPTGLPVTKGPVTPETTSTPASTPQRKNKDFLDPCIPSQTTCEKDCGGDYVKGPQGCQYCICASLLPNNLRPNTTLAPLVPYRPANETYNQQVMTEACTNAKAICQVKCPNGFQSVPDHCLVCQCSDKEDDQTEDPGFLIKLPNPCIQGLDQCELLCKSGYLLGPRRCQFCTCR